MKVSITVDIGLGASFVTAGICAALLVIGCGLAVIALAGTVIGTSSIVDAAFDKTDPNKEIHDNMTDPFNWLDATLGQGKGGAPGLYE